MNTDSHCRVEGRQPEPLRPRIPNGTPTAEWGTDEAVALYLDRCQVDTPYWLVRETWKHICERRDRIETVVDFGAGDGRFADGGPYRSYTGYEIDRERISAAELPPSATLINECAFSHVGDEADVCIGNPPYVRNQDLPAGWRERAAAVVNTGSGTQISGLANAWQYFAFLSLLSTNDQGLVALIIPFEWVSRPSSETLRRFIKDHNWEVAVYRLPDAIFPALTTASITIIDKGKASGEWRYYEYDDAAHCVHRMPSETGGSDGVLAYSSTISERQAVSVKRGLSPGTQRVLVLTEGERAHNGLEPEVDVVPCVTTLRPLEPTHRRLTIELFDERYRSQGLKCWLIRTDQAPGPSLRAYLDSVPLDMRSTATCEARDVWWQFAMPTAPSAFVATGFRGSRPKAVVNRLGAMAVGGVAGVYGVTPTFAAKLVGAIGKMDLGSRVVAHSKGLRKLEIGQLTTVVDNILNGNGVR